MIDDEPRAAKMSLRDFFAAMAMQGMLAGDTELDTPSLTKVAYTVADAMFEAREKEPYT